MINIFNRIYLQLDNDLACSSGQERLIFTPREFSTPFPDPEVAKIVGIVDIVRDDISLDERYGGIDGLLSFLAITDRKLCVIVSQENAARLMISIWKVLFKKHTPQSLYALFKLFVNNQNLHTAHIDERSDVDGMQEDTYVPVMSEREFTNIYNVVAASQFVTSMKPEAFPVEYFLAGHLCSNNTQKNENIFIDKVRDIVFTNIITLLSNDKVAFFRTTQNHYLANGNDAYRGADDPLAIMRTDPDFKWINDPLFSADNMDHVRRNYRLSDIKDIFKQYNNVFAKGNRFFDMEEFFDIFVTGNIPALIKADIADENGNIFSERSFVRKINGLFISRMYHLARVGEVEKLKIYELAI